MHWVTLAVDITAFACGFTTTIAARRQIKKVKRRRTTMSPRCPGRLDPACTCDGACQSAGPGGAAVPCSCVPCVAHIGAGFSPLVSFASQTPMPRGSGSGMTGFAEAGNKDFDFAVGSVSGLRQWTLEGPDFSADPHQADTNWKAVQLKGATGFAWPAGVQEAKCNNGHKHDPPTENDPATGKCGCGFWAYWDMAGLSANRFSTSGRGLPVLGVIQGYGRTLIGEKGFRSQKARIIALAPAFSIQAEVSWRGPQRSPWDRTPLGSDPVTPLSAPAWAEDQKDEQEIQLRAQQHADAWMAVIQDRLGQMYPGAKVYATAAGLLASVKTEGRP